MDSISQRIAEIRNQLDCIERKVTKSPSTQSPSDKDFKWYVDEFGVIQKLEPSAKSPSEYATKAYRDLVDRANSAPKAENADPNLRSEEDTWRELFAKADVVNGPITNREAALEELTRQGEAQGDYALSDEVDRDAARAKARWSKVVDRYVDELSGLSTATQNEIIDELIRIREARGDYYFPMYIIDEGTDFTQDQWEEWLKPGPIVFAPSVQTVPFAEAQDAASWGDTETVTAATLPRGAVVKKNGEPLELATKTVVFGHPRALERLGLDSK